MLTTLICAAFFPLPGSSYAGLPQLQTANNYRILSENVQLNIGSDDRLRILSTSVYRNIGDSVRAKITFADGFLTSSFPGSKVIAKWDNQPIEFHQTFDSAGNSVATADVSLSKEATHSLKLILVARLARAGLGKDQFRFSYLLSGNHPIDLFSLAYRYVPGSIFGLPTLKPDLGWEIGEKGAAIRKTDFTPSDEETSIEFYRNSMKPLGTGG